MRTCDDTHLRASSYEPSNRASSVTGTNSVVCSWEISARSTGMNSSNTTKLVEHKLVLKKGETAVHCCDPALSVLVMLVSRNVFHIVSALQYIYRLYNLFFLLIRSLVHPTLAALIVCDPLQFKVARNSFHFPQTSFTNSFPHTVWFIVSV